MSKLSYDTVLELLKKSSQIDKLELKLFVVEIKKRNFLVVQSSGVGLEARTKFCHRIVLVMTDDITTTMSW